MSVKERVLAIRIIEKGKNMKDFLSEMGISAEVKKQNVVIGKKTTEKAENNYI